MPFHRFEDFERNYLSPHLSTGEGPVIEGEYMYFCKVSKVAGTGSQLHYHPNELMIFPLLGKINALVGKDRRVVEPGTFVHVPAYARHQMGATEDGDMDYLYVKDRTWSVVGLAPEEAPPEEAPTVEEITIKHETGEWAKQEKNAEKSEIIIEGINNTYYPIIPSLDAPPCSGLHSTWIEGERLAFGFVEMPAGHEEATSENAHEQFVYVIKGTLDAHVDDERKEAGPGTIIHIPKGSRRGLSSKGEYVRYASVRATARVEEMLRKK